MIHVQKKGRYVQTYMNGELSGCSDICELLHNDFYCTLQIMGGYSSWLNGKANRYICTLENMNRKLRGDANMSRKL